MSIDGSRIRRVDMPHAEVLAITLATAFGKEIFVARLTGVPRGVGLTTERPRGAPASAFVQRLRKLLEGSSVVSAVALGKDGARLELARGDEQTSLLVVPDVDAGRIAVVGPGGRVLASAGRGPLPTDSGGATLDGEALRAIGATLVRGAVEDAEGAARKALDRALKKAHARLERRLDAIAEDAARASEAPGLRDEAGVILAHAHAWSPGSATLDVLDYREDPPVERTIAIDPSKGAHGVAEALYRRARRVERGGVMAEERARTTREEQKRIDGWRMRLAAAENLDAIRTIAGEAAARGVRGAREAVPAKGGSPAGPRIRSPAETRLPYRAFECAGGQRVLVGRGAADNDALTLHHARPHDLWLHARGHTGAHVVVPLARGKTCPPDLLADAAMLAAHFSDARGEPIVDVIHVARRHVHKPRGAAPGLVRVEREKVFAVRLVESRVAALLAQELH